MTDKKTEALKLALADSALDRMAENARALGLDYEPAQQQEHVDSAEKAGAYMEARLWEFIDMAAIWPEAKPDQRTWAHVMVYAPPASKPWVGLTDEEVKHLWEVWRANSTRYVGFAKGIEAKLKERNA